MIPLYFIASSFTAGINKLENKSALANPPGNLL